MEQQDAFAPPVIKLTPHQICFNINGDTHILDGSKVTTLTTLNDFIRYEVELRGTKVMCDEGGCGACVVGVTIENVDTKKRSTFAVNSCLVHVLSCHQWDVTTIEGVGNSRVGVSTLQKRLAMFNGSQCGYCTPGMVMNMHCLREKAKEAEAKLSMNTIERSFGGNICRCTGYRPILDAFKSFADDVSDELLQRVQDIEDINLKCAGKCSRRCSLGDEWVVVDFLGKTLLEIPLKDGPRWYKAYLVEDVFNVLNKEGLDSYMLVAGNTAKGVFKEPEPQVYIDIFSVDALKEIVIDEYVTIGAGVNLTEWMEQCYKISRMKDDFKYLEHLHDHLDLVGNVPLRNLGTIAGNLVMKHKHNEFQSDIFLILEMVEATVTIMGSNMEKKEVDMQQFLKENLSGKLIFSVKLPPLGPLHHIRTYKLMPRAQNAHAIVNAGFHVTLDRNNIVVSSVIVYGGINETFSRAFKTEAAIKRTPINSDLIIRKAFSAMIEEIIPVDAPPEPSALCKRFLVYALFYKTLLSWNPTCSTRYRSGITLLERGLSRGQQTFETDDSLWPINQPMPKIDAVAQCAGEVNYAVDVTLHRRRVHVALVLADVTSGVIDDIDQNPALLPGVIAVFTALDIPGKNSFTPKAVPGIVYEEEILASKIVKYYGQPVAIVAASSHKLAIKAAGLVKVTYKRLGTRPMLTMEDVMKSFDKDKKMRRDVYIQPTEKGSEIRSKFNGTFSMPSQFHYFLEPHSCVVVPRSRGLRVRSATQWMDLVQIAVAECVGVAINKVEVQVPRVGGSFGGKASRSALVACACALVAHRLQRDASLVLPLGHALAALGKRMACLANYEVAVNSDGVIQYLDLTYYSNCGYNLNDSAAPSIADTIMNLYENRRFKITGFSVVTDNASNTWCRAPSSTEATAIMEHIMEKIAFTLKKDSARMRLVNLPTKHNELKDMLYKFNEEARYYERKEEIKQYNKDHAWKKKGIGLAIMAFPLDYEGNFAITISVYHGDGTIRLSHGGIEMGQGIDTKVAQVVAKKLSIPIDIISFKAPNTFTSPNATPSNGSISSDSVAYAAVRACEILLERLEPIKQKMEIGTDWPQLVKEAFNRGINLQTSYMMSSEVDKLNPYTIYGVCSTEIELDVLTGQHIIRRADILEDTGVSLNPDVDVGQVEGSFVMGLGLWTCEELKYHPETGRILTDSTWTYKPCGARDIPEDFRIKFHSKSPNQAFILRSKATGEPALTMAVSVTHALHDAIVEARKEYHIIENEWLDIKVPYSIENILKAIEPKTDAYKMYI